MLDGKVVEGRDGWLFLANDTNEVLAQHRGERVLTAEGLDAWESLMAKRSTLGQYRLLVPPNTHSVRSDKLGIEPAAVRPVTQLMERVENIVYPLQAMKSADHDVPVVMCHDSHWSTFGAFIAYRELMQSIGVPAFEDVHFFLNPNRSGDLGDKLDPPRLGTRVSCDLPKRARMVSDNRIPNRGGVVITESPAEQTCLVFGDSYAIEVVRYMSESFGRLVFCFWPAVDYGVVEREQPDYVVSILNERFLINVPDDSSSFDAMSAEKKAAGLVRFTFAPLWR
jgi:hypothetical protein